MRIAQASITENNDDGWNRKAKAGDQTGREVFVRKWYPYDWDGIIHCLDENISNKVAEIAIKLANSNLVGYDQSERNTLYQALKKNGWDVDKYIKSGKCTETDCSAFVYACYCCVVPALRNDGNAPTVPQLKARFTKLDIFKWYTAKRFRTKDTDLRAGDILVNTDAHAVMAVDTGSTYSENKPSTPTAPSTPSVPKTVKASKSASNFDRAIAGTYKTTDALNLRDGAGTRYKVLTCMPNKTKVENYGYYSYDGNTKWYYIKTVINGITYIGFCSSKYLRKV